jgi:hypothetical protein
VLTKNNEIRYLRTLTMASSVKQPAADATQDRSPAEAIARESDVPPEVVREIYEQELSSLASHAKITQYLGVLASRRVRMMLRKQ